MQKWLYNDDGMGSFVCAHAPVTPYTRMSLLFPGGDIYVTISDARDSARAAVYALAPRVSFVYGGRVVARRNLGMLVVRAYPRELLPFVLALYDMFGIREWPYPRRNLVFSLVWEPDVYSMDTGSSEVDLTGATVSCWA